MAAKRYIWTCVCILLLSAASAMAQESEGTAPASDAPASAPGEGQGNGGGAGCTWQTMVPLLAIVAVFYFLIIMPQRKREKKRKQLLGQVKKHDRVMTVGGIHGVVYSVSEEEVVLKVDEKNDVRMRFARSAISRILGSEGDAPDVGLSGDDLGASGQGSMKGDAPLPHEKR